MNDGLCCGEARQEDRVRQDRFNPKPLDLASLVEQTIEANRDYAKQFQATFSFENAAEGAKVNVDSDRLIQALTNLLSNAAKFSPPQEA